MYGVQIAFRDYNPVGGFFGSPWVGLKWFERFFNNYNSIRMIKKYSIAESLQYFVDISNSDHTGTFDQSGEVEKVPACFADDTLCTSFISTMILCGMLRIFLSPYGGLISTIIQAFGGKATNLMTLQLHFVPSTFHLVYARTQVGEQSFTLQHYQA